MSSDGNRSNLSVFYVEVDTTFPGSAFEPPEYGCSCGIYVAETRGKAKMMNVAEWNLDLPDDFLYAKTQRLGVPNEREASPGKLSDKSRWWGRVRIERYDQKDALCGRGPGCDKPVGHAGNHRWPRRRDADASQA